eukprot:TRINITY_DN300_c0_g1_i1.p1 TRINITY_DN300_c0_g1~~TRINITY_DN300_c0_g1_i1.p1  ORF type:complete len:334 (+),score=77.74 TRINITY_DN300_c0_g1_i1:45-1004(+)
MKKVMATRKTFGKPLDNVFLVSLPNHESLSKFLLEVPGCEPIERFVGKEILFFEGALTHEERVALRAKPRKNFRKEIRRSRVLILTIKGKATLTLEEGLQIVAESPLRGDMDLIELIAVNPKTFKPKEGVEPWDMMVHVYIQFATEEDARSRVNTVDAMRYKDYYVHSPQCDEHQMFYPDSGYHKSDYIWINENAKKVARKLKPSEEDSPPPLEGSVKEQAEAVPIVPQQTAVCLPQPLQQLQYPLVRQMPAAQYITPEMMLSIQQQYLLQQSALQAQQLQHQQQLLQQQQQQQQIMVPVPYPVFVMGNQLQGVNGASS